MNKTLKTLLLILIFASALGLRLVDFDDPPLDFHPSRQMHSALMARGFWLESGGYMEDRSAEYNGTAKTIGMQEPWIEPPIYESLTAVLYRLFGNADLRIPRGTSIIFWLIGGLGLVFLADSLFGSAGLFTGLGWFFFFPYGVIASRSFQPDIIMVCLLVWSMFLLKRWTEQPGSFVRMLLFALCAGLCILVKQVAAFPLGLAAAAGLISSLGWKNTLKNYRVWLAAVLCLGPMLLYNYWGYFVKGFLVQQYQGRFFLSELIRPAFYVRWLRMIDQVFSIPLFFGALFGILMIRDQVSRVSWMAYFVGYVLYGLSLPHHIGTHNYYQLLIFPFTAIGIASLMKCAGRGIMKAARKRSRLIPAMGILCAVVLCVWWAADSVMAMRRVDYRTWPDRWTEWMDELEPYENSISTIGIMDDYGSGMAYWGLHNPMIWDTSVESMDDFDALVKLNTTFWNYRWLVVTDLEKFYEQPRLQRYLSDTAKIHRQEADYIIFDLGN